jgi:hypothetical protein
MLRLRSRKSLDQPIRRASAPQAFLPEAVPAGQASKFLRFSMIANTSSAARPFEVPNLYLKDSAFSEKVRLILQIAIPT